MNYQAVKSKKLPDKPGVYFFLDKNKKPIYIGKATSLRDRVKSYFGKDIIETRGPIILDMVFKSHDLKWQETDSVLEALILEANLIKKYQPKYNTKEKDNKSFNYVCITKEAWPKIVIERGKNLEKHTQSAYTPWRILGSDDKSLKFASIYGPYTHGGSLREALKIIRRIFPFLEERTFVRGRYEFYRQLGLVPDVTEEKASAEYKKIIVSIKLLLDGKKKSLIVNLKKQMKSFAAKHDFENAGRVRNQIFALEHIHDVSLIKEENIEEKNAADKAFRIEAYDVAHTSGKNMVGVMTVVEDGEAEKKEYRKFNIRGFSSSNDTGALSEILERRFTHPEWRMPDLIAVDGSTAQKNAAEKVLKNLDMNIPVVAVVKNEFHRPERILGNDKYIYPYEKSILLANSEAHRFAIGFHREKRRKNLFGK